MLNLQKKFVVALSVIFVAIAFGYLKNQPIEFGCDSLVFYQYGREINYIFKEKLFAVFLIVLISFFIFFKKINKVSLNKIILFLGLFFMIYLVFIVFFFQNNYDISNLQRPPFYSFFLVISGLFNFETFKTFIFFQIILSYLSLLMFFNVLVIYTNSLKLSFILTSIFAFTSIPYILLKFVIAEQLLFFLSVSTYFFLIIHNKTNEHKYIFLGLISATFAWLTKWEGQLLFFSATIYVFFNLSIKNFIETKKVLILFFIPFLMLTSWVVTRSEITNDYSSFTSISNTNSEQFFFKFYNALPSELYNFKKKMNMKISDEKYNFIFDNQRQILIIDKTNGPYSEQLYKATLEYILTYPYSYKEFDKILKNAYQYNNRNYDLYYELFGKFENDSQSLAANIFSQPNIWYYTFINSGLEKTVGKNEKDKIFKYSILEGFKKHPITVLLFISDFLKASGVDLEKYFYTGQTPLGGISKLNFVTPYDAGKCASNNLGDTKLKQYEESHQYWNESDFFKNIVLYTDYLNDFIRAYFGIFFFMSAIYLIIFNYKIFIPFAIFPFSYDLLLALTVGPNKDTKYEVITFSIKYLILSICFIFLINSLRSLLKKKLI